MKPTELSNQFAIAKPLGKHIDPYVVEVLLRGTRLIGLRSMQIFLDERFCSAVVILTKQRQYKTARETLKEISLVNVPQPLTG